MEDEVEYAKRRSKRNRKRCIIGLSILLVLLLIIAIIVVVILVVLPLYRGPADGGEFRLPTSLTPDQYFLELQPYLSPGNFTFDGGVNITITCHKSTNNITLHSSGLTIHKATVREVTSGSNPGVKKIEIIPEYELLILHLKDELKAEKMYQLHFEFSGVLGTSVGFYWRKYKGEKSERYIAATKFKPTYARRAFPCFDEPSFKATFAITIVRENRFSSLTTGGNKKKDTEKRQPRGNDWTADIYQSTIKISPHLLGFFVGEYISTRVTKDKVSVVARIQSIKYSEYAMTAALNASEFYFSKLRVPLNMPVLDLVAIPDKDREEEMPDNFEDFGEESTSWGLIQMDESSMLSRPQDGEWQRQDVAVRVAHQVAHQLFGILVTPKWWSELWLTESIATYLGKQAADNIINPKWKTLEALKRSNDDVEFDCSESSRPLWMDVDEPSDISKSFNRALYKKGARLIDMTHGLLSDKKFWQGLSKFLQETYSVAEADNFWRDLTETQKNGDGKIDFEAVMKSWVHNRGHPIVTLKRDYSQKTALISQQSCLNESTVWQIPVMYNHKRAASRDQTEIIWLRSTNKTLYSMPSKNGWILLNGYLNGFFHVNYDTENWKMLAEQLRDNPSIFPSSTRYQLLYDALFLAKMNFITYDIMFDLLLYMRRENDLDVKEFLAKAKLSEIWKMLRMSNVDSKWKDYVLHVIGDTYRELFSENIHAPELELLPKLYLKQEIASSACYYDKHVCVNEAVNKAKSWLRKGEPFKDVSMVDSFLMRPFLCTAVRRETSIGDDINSILKDKTNSYLQNKTVMKDLMYALGCSNTVHRSSVYMERFIIEDGDPAPFIESMLNSHNGSDNLFHFLMNNIYRLRKNYMQLELVVKRLSEAVANLEELTEMKKVFDTFIDKMNEEKNTHEAKRIMKMLDSYTGMATRRLEFVKYQLPSMVQWLKKYTV